MKKRFFELLIEAAQIIVNHPNWKDGSSFITTSCMKDDIREGIEFILSNRLVYVPDVQYMRILVVADTLKGYVPKKEFAVGDIVQWSGEVICVGIHFPGWTDFKIAEINGDEVTVNLITKNGVISPITVTLSKNAFKHKE